MDSYNGKAIEELPKSVLLACIMHLAHDLDKTINTEAGTPEFLINAARESRDLEGALKVWEERENTECDATKWARDILTEACNLTKDFCFDLKSNSHFKAEEAQGLMELIKARRSVRRWIPAEIPRQAIELLLEAAIWAPSACNRQSCRYIVLTERSQKETLVRLREKFLGQAPVLILVGADKRNYYSEEADIVPYLDAAMASQNILLMAHTIGLGAVFTKCTDRDIRWVVGEDRSQAISEAYTKLNLPDYFIPVGVVAIGFPASQPKPPSRRPITEVAFWEYFPEKKEDMPGPVITEMNLKKKVKRFVIIPITRLIIRIISKLAWRLGIRVYMTMN